MGLLALLIQECLFFLGYVTGSQQYPKPLTRREEAKLLAEMAEGSEEARRELILHNLRLVAHIARKYTVPGHNAEDLTSIGVVGLIKAVGSYRQGGGTSLGTYAARCIENEILMFLRKTVRTKVEISLDEPLNTDSDGNELQLTDVLGMYEDSVYDVTEKGAMNECLYKALGKLKSRERMIVEMRFGLIYSEE